MKLLIKNNYSFHWEIIESVIVKYYEILKIDKETPIEIYLSVNNENSFVKYIEKKYPEIKFKNINDYDYSINCTVYDKNFDKLNIDINSNTKYIAHDITERLKNNPNIFFLTPLAVNNIFNANILPYSDIKIKTDIPIYIIQGNIERVRRNFGLLKKLLDNESYKYDFKIKILGRGNLPDELKKHKNKIIIKSNLNFIDFHKEFCDGYCIIPLTSKDKQPQYYKNKLTSSINYTRGYKLKCLLDKNLNDIYNLENAEIYNDSNDIIMHFEKTLEDFYNSKI